MLTRRFSDFTLVVKVVVQVVVELHRTPGRRDPLKTWIDIMSIIGEAERARQRWDSVSSVELVPRIIDIHPAGLRLAIV